MSGHTVSPKNHSWCYRCKSHKPISEFGKNGHGRIGSGVDWSCRQCTSFIRKTSYKKHRNAWLARRAMYRRIVFNTYSGTPPRCQCAGCPLPEMNILFLEVDHIRGLGKAEAEYARLHGQRLYKGHHLYRWLIKNNFPSGYQILCSNCNHGKERNGGICPHISDNFEVQV